MACYCVTRFAILTPAGTREDRKVRKIIFFPVGIAVGMLNFHIYKVSSFDNNSKTITAASNKIVYANLQGLYKLGMTTKYNKKYYLSLQNCLWNYYHNYLSINLYSTAINSIYRV